MPRAKIKYLFLLTIIVGVLFLLYRIFLSGMFGQGGMPPMFGGPMPVGVAEVVVKDVQAWREYSGRLVAVEKAEIRPQVAGIIQKVHFKGGEQVKKGQALFTLDQRPFIAALQAAEASHVQAAGELARANRLIKEKAISQREYDVRRSTAESAAAALTKARLDVEYSQVKSPIAGRVSRPELTVGNVVDGGGGAPILTTVVSNNPIYADFEIDEQSYLAFLQRAKSSDNSRVPVHIQLSGDDTQTYEGYVQSFDNMLDPASGTLRVRAVFDNASGALLPGLFVRTKLADASARKMLLITDRAIGTDQNKKFVYVVGDDQKATYREIQLGERAEGMRVVEKGLSAGEKIVVNGLQRVKPGAEVKPEMVSMDSLPPQASDSDKETDEAEASPDAAEAQ